jgi:FMN reductase
MFSYLHAAVVPTGVFAASEDWAAAGVDGQLRARIDRAAAELAALVQARPAPEPVDQFDRDVAGMGDFESLLKP